MAAVRLHHLIPEFAGRVHLRVRAFPLEVMGGEAAPRAVLDQEWWLAALQEPLAEFKPWQGDDWPTTTLPAFEAAWYVAEHAPAAFLDYDLRIRRAFFAESRNIGRPEVLLDIAREAGLDADRLKADLATGRARGEVLEEARLGKDRFKVRGTPTMMLRDGTKLRLPLAFPQMRDDRVVGVTPLPCHGDECLEATRALFTRALGGEADKRHRPS